MNSITVSTCRAKCSNILHESVIPQMIVNLWAISNATFIKRFNQMTLLNGEKVRPKVTVKAGGKTFS
jgi:hypothetical protein